MSSIEAIQAVGLTSMNKVAEGIQQTTSIQSTDFLKHLDNVNKQLQVADTNLQNVALGNKVQMHEVLIQMEQTRVSFELMVETRNKLLEAYQEVMRMQI